jgi:tripartite-type tricarboxylate transporter receptor subunit TctC
MKSSLHKTLLAAAAAAAGLFSLTATAQGNYPNKPIRVIVGVAPGGLIDISARLVSTQLSTRLGQAIVIENRPGAATTIAANAVLKSDPDGYTFFYGGAMSASPIFVKNGAVDFVSQMKPVSQTLSAPFYLLLSTKVPANTLQELIDYSKKNPGKLNQADISPASTMVMHAIAERSGLDFTPVAYKGSAPALIALISGEVDMVLDTVPNYIPHIKAGKVKAIANTGRARMPQLPEVPFGIETKAIDFSTGSMFGFWAPPNTPDAIIKRVSEEIAALSKDAAFRAKFREATHVDPIGSSPAELLKVVEADKALYERVAKKIAYKPQ